MKIIEYKICKVCKVLVKKDIVVANPCGRPSYYLLFGQGQPQPLQKLKNASTLSTFNFKSARFTIFAFYN